MSKKFESLVYRLASPGEIEETVMERELKDGWVAVQPKLASICHADLRYYTGKRRPEALAKKLPMALLHEGMGTVIHSSSENFSKGDRVVIVPNIPGEILHPSMKQKSNIPENYGKENAFLGSGYDGIAQSVLVHPAECLVKIPDEVPDNIAVLAELCTVSYHAASHVYEKLFDKNSNIALFGDGPVGYFTASTMRYVYGIEKERLTVFGADKEKLKHFDFAETESVLEYDFTNNTRRYDVVLECTGGKFSESAINQGIDVADSCADIILMGVTEARVPINTRDTLEKGLTLHGSSRSSTEDFQAVMEAFKNAAYRDALAKILPSEEDLVTRAEDFKSVMSWVAENPRWNKTIIRFQWNG